MGTIYSQKLLDPSSVNQGEPCLYYLYHTIYPQLFFTAALIAAFDSIIGKPTK
jgi:hypothetical protein